MAKRGAPTKLTAATANTIIGMMRAGAFKNAAAAATGISPNTLELWLTRGDRGDRAYEDFAREFHRAEALAALSAQAVITRAAIGPIDGSWKAAAWWLQRRFPLIYGHRAAGHTAEAEASSGDAAMTFYQVEH